MKDEIANCKIDRIHSMEHCKGGYLVKTRMRIRGDVYWYDRMKEDPSISVNDRSPSPTIRSEVWTSLHLSYQLPRKMPRGYHIHIPSRINAEAFSTRIHPFTK